MRPSGEVKKTAERRRHRQIRLGALVLILLAALIYVAAFYLLTDNFGDLSQPVGAASRKQKPAWAGVLFLTAVATMCLAFGIYTIRRNRVK